MCVFAGSRNQNSLRYTNMVCKILNNFCKFFSVDYTHWQLNLCKVTKKSKNSQNLSDYHY